MNRLDIIEPAKNLSFWQNEDSGVNIIIRPVKESDIQNLKNKMKSRKTSKIKHKYHIRKAVDADAEGIKEVVESAIIPLRKIYKPTKAAYKRRKSKRKLRIRLVCIYKNKIAGTVEYEVQEDKLHIMGPMVHQKYQRKGIARALIDYISNIASDSGKNALSINTCKQTGNVAIFKKIGFKVIKESKDDNGLAENLTDEELIDVYMERIVKSLSLVRKMKRVFTLNI